MLLALDIGNTTVAAALMTKDGGAWQLMARGRIATTDLPDADALMAKLAALSGFVPLWDCAGVVYSSVVPAVSRLVEEAAAQLPAGRALAITRESDTGLIYPPALDRSTIGNDRFVDAAWAAAHRPLPAVTVDMGTATTFNVIGEGGVFLGGLISAGVSTGLRGLHEHTAQLPLVHTRTPDALIGVTTEGCMLAGAVYGAAAMIDGITDRIETLLGKPVTLIMTGGAAAVVHPLCRRAHEYDPDLLMKGLADLYDRHRENTH